MKHLGIAVKDCWAIPLASFGLCGNAWPVPRETQAYIDQRFK